MPQLPDDPMFREFFGRRFQSPRQQRDAPRQSGLGSGVITTPDGYILTNNHVIDGADRVRVELTDKRTFDAKVVGTDPASDLAVLKIDAQGLHTLPIGDSNRVSVGDVVLAIGNPLGVGQTVTMGIISAKGRATGVGDGSYEDFLQTDARDQPGQLRRRAHQPERRARRHQLADPDADRRQHRPRLCDSVEHGAPGHGPVEDRRQGQPQQARRHGPERHRGHRREPEAGRRERCARERRRARAARRLAPDCGRETSSSRSTARSWPTTTRCATASPARKPGSKVAVEILRDGRKETLQATLDAEADPERTAAASSGDAADARGFGMTVQPLTPEVARELELTGRREGVVIRERRSRRCRGRGRPAAWRRHRAGERTGR